MKVLQTERLILRRFCDQDLDAYASMCADPEVMRYLLVGKTLTREEAWQHMAGIEGHWQLRGYGLLAVEERESGTLVGRIGFLKPEGWPGFELAWTLARPYWGRGYATEGARAAMAYAFEELGQDKIISLIHPDNKPSIRLAERLGETLEDTIVIKGRKTLRYSISRASWKKTRSPRIVESSGQFMDDRKQINIGLIGFGTVGTGLVQYFQDGRADSQNIRLKKVAVSSLTRPREIDFPNLTDRVEDILGDPDISIVVELIGGEEPARTYLLGAMKEGKSVVTANKVVLSRHMRQLFDVARENEVDLAFEASVAASIPLIRILKGYRGESISRISGILNGTSNYILSQMGHGLDFESALSRAIDYGYAEADHLLDTGGYDARDKLAIIASLVYDTEIRPEEIYCEGINSITLVDLDFAAKYGVEEGGSGYSIKSLATAEMTDGRLALHVYPALISQTHPLSSVQNELNAIYLHGDLSGPQLFQGRGAGREATNSAVVSDIIRLAKNRRRGIVEALPGLNSKVITADVDSLKRKGYVRINLRHVPGSIANASRIMADHGFNIEDSIQRRRFQFRVNEETVIPDIVTVEPLPYRTVQNALKELGESDSIDGKPFFLRFEE